VQPIIPAVRQSLWTDRRGGEPNKDAERREQLDPPDSRERPANFRKEVFMENSDVILQILAGVFIGLLIKYLLWH
jgi:hypothetical protein